MHSPLIPIIVSFNDLPSDPIEFLSGLAVEPSFVFSRRDGAERAHTFTYAAFDTPYNTVTEGDDDRWPTLLDSQAGFSAELDARLGPFQGGAALVLAHDAPGPDKAIPRFRIIRLREFIVIDAHNRCCHFVHFAERDDSELRAAVESKARRLLHSDPKLLAMRKPISLEAHAWQSDVTQTVYAQQVKAIKDAIHSDHVRQVVLSIGLKKSTTSTPWGFFRRIAEVNPAPHAFFVRTEDFSLAGSSPLMLVRAAQGWAEIETDAGTRPVVADEAANREAELNLIGAFKDRVEQALIVEATRTDLEKIAQTEVSVSTPLEVRRFSHVMHLYTVFRCCLKNELTPGRLLDLLSPSPALVGFPKMKASAFVASLEKVRRGLYGGVVALVGHDGAVDACLILRSAWYRDGAVFLRSGGGIVPESDVESEYDECFHKANAVFLAVALAEQDLAAATHADELASNRSV